MPRSPLRGQPATKRIFARITEEELLALRALAQANSLTISALIGEAVAEFAAESDGAGPIKRTCCIGSLCGFCLTQPQHRS